MKIPTFGAVMEKHGVDRSALDNFILFCEPAADPEKSEFRRYLQELVDELGTDPTSEEPR